MSGGAKKTTRARAPKRRKGQIACLQMHLEGAKSKHAAAVAADDVELYAHKVVAIKRQIRRLNGRRINLAWTIEDIQKQLVRGPVVEPAWSKEIQDRNTAHFHDLPRRLKRAKLELASL